MFAHKEISRKFCGPTRSESAPHLLVWVYRERYNSVFSYTKNAALENSESKTKSIRRKERRANLKCKRSAKEREANEKFLNNLSNYQLTDSQVSVLSKGLKFIPTPMTNESIIRRQLL